MSNKKEFKIDPELEIVETISSVNDANDYIFIDMSKDNKNKEFIFAGPYFNIPGSDY